MVKICPLTDTYWAPGQGLCTLAQYGAWSIPGILLAIARQLLQRGEDEDTTVLNHPPEIKKVRNDPKSVPKVLVLVILENQSAQIGPLGVFEK